MQDRHPWFPGVKRRTANSSTERPQAIKMETLKARLNAWLSFLSPEKN
jgi:hypothetical protein